MLVYLYIRADITQQTLHTDRNALRSLRIILTRHGIYGPLRIENVGKQSAETQRFVLTVF